MKRILLIAIVLTAIRGLAQDTALEGLWVVSKVTVGNKTMTPNAKWTQFNADGTQQSGNGWKQHSIGSWTYDDGERLLSIVTDNGVKDSYGPFTVTQVSDTQMKWQRQEESSTVVVDLERIKTKPMTYADQLLGLWKLEQQEGSQSLLSDIAYLFIRWDGKFVIGTREGKRFGVYSVHGHKPEIELIPYDGGVDRSFWAVQYQGEGIRLKLLNADEEIISSFVRTNEYPK